VKSKTIAIDTFFRVFLFQPKTKTPAGNEGFKVSKYFTNL